MLKKRPYERCADEIIRGNSIETNVTYCYELRDNHLEPETEG